MFEQKDKACDFTMKFKGFSTFLCKFGEVFLLEEVSYKYLVKMEFLRNKRTRKATKAILISRAKGRVI